ASASAVAPNFSAPRLKRDILRRSNIGLIATRRSVGLNGTGSNAVAGVDANLFLHTNVTANGYNPRSQTTDGSGATDSYRGTLDYSGDRYGFTGEHLLIARNFDVQTGYVRRTDF